MKIKDFLNESYDEVSYRVTLPEWDDKFLDNKEDIYTFYFCWSI